ncbi:MAG: hypothetical protein J4F40_18230 [Alphaproteobacteria bacterium]|nr:hypothetical protein [Alphaproteobacteria bacterium]
MSRRPLREIAHARAGDKGNRSNVSVFAYAAEHYPVLLAEVTPARLKREFGGVLRGEIVRYELPNLNGINLVSVNESLNLDGHGKSWSSLILGMEIEVP